MTTQYFFFTEIDGNIYLVVVKIVVGQHLKLPEHLVRFSFFFFPFLTFNDHNWDVVFKNEKKINSHPI